MREMREVELTTVVERTWKLTTLPLTVLALLLASSNRSPRCCALRKITTSRKVLNHEIQGAQHKAYMKENRLSGRPKAKVSHLRHPGTLRTQPWKPLESCEKDVKRLSKINQTLSSGNGSASGTVRAGSRRNLPATPHVFAVYFDFQLLEFYELA